MSTPARYDTVARLLHWLIVALVIAQYAIGWTMPDVHRDTQPVGLIAAHLLVGTRCSRRWLAACCGARRIARPRVTCRPRCAHCRARRISRSTRC